MIQCDFLSDIKHFSGAGSQLWIYKFIDITLLHGNIEIMGKR